MGNFNRTPIYRNTVETIEITMNWQGCLPILLATHENATRQGREAANTELRRMAQVADLACEMGTLTDEERELLTLFRSMSPVQRDELFANMATTN